MKLICIDIELFRFFLYFLADCAGIPNGNTAVDECGECGGDNSSCGKLLFPFWCAMLLMLTQKKKHKISHTCNPILSSFLGDWHEA